MELELISLDAVEKDSLIDALQSQVAFYKGEYENLKLETRSLITDNTELSKQLELQIRKNNEIQSIQVLKESEEETLVSLRKQLALLQKEKDSFESLWKTSQNTIKNLENELKAYQSIKRTPLLYNDSEEFKQDYSSIVKMLESKLSSLTKDSKEQQHFIETITEERELLKKKLCDSEKSITEYSIKESEFKIKIESLEKDLLLLKNELLMSKNNIEDLVNKMEICHKNLEACARKELESRNKVSEALFLVETAIKERDAATKKYDDATGAAETIRLSSQITDVLNESSERIQKELAIAKQTYNDKLNDMLIHIQRLELELGEKNLSIECLQRECSALEEKLKRKKQQMFSNKDGKHEKLLIAEQKLEATFQQLLISERRNIQIISEKENMQMDYDQMKANFQREKRKREWEDKLQLNEINSLRIQIGNLKDALSEAHQLIQNLQSQMLCKNNIEEKLTSDKYTVAKEFEKYFDTQHKLNVKWKENMKEITRKLELKVDDLLEQIKALKKENAELRIRNSKMR